MYILKLLAIISLSTSIYWPYKAFSNEYLRKELRTIYSANKCQKFMMANSKMDTDEFFDMLKGNLEIEKFLKSMSIQDLSDVLLVDRSELTNHLSPGTDKATYIQPEIFVALDHIFPNIIDLQFLFNDFGLMNRDGKYSMALQYFIRSNKARTNKLRGKGPDAFKEHVEKMRTKFADKAPYSNTYVGYEKLKRIISGLESNPIAHIPAQKQYKFYLEVIQFERSVGMVVSEQTLKYLMLDFEKSNP